MDNAIINQSDYNKDKKTRLKEEICARLKARPPEMKRCEWLSVVASEYQVSTVTVRRYEREIREGKTERRGRGMSVWSYQALSWLRAYYLLATKEVGSCSKKGAYKALLGKAAEEGWQVGSEKSAYYHLKKITPVVHKYARGGDRAIDNTFYIMRDLDSLDPFQVVVGDQHIFNWWICDYETMEVYRLQCYLWLDMYTRLPYGIAFDRKYSSSTVKRALQMGLERFGKFKCTYNDNGRPELSKDIAQVVREIQVYGLKWEDISQLYATGKGYALVHEDHEFPDYAETPEEWKRRNRQIFAKVKNAKTKPIERFFDSLESLLLDRALPGMCRNLADDAAVDERQTLRLKRQKEQHLLLSEEEFILKVLDALEEYENRTHTSLKCSPKEKLFQAMKEGWRPEKIDPLELKFIFLNKDYPKVTNGRIRLANELYESTAPLTEEDLSDSRNHVLGYEGQKIQVRWDPRSPEYAWAVGTDGRVFPLKKVRKYQFLDEQEAREALEWKGHQKKAVRDAFKKMTSGIDGPVLQSSYAATLRKAEQRRIPSVKESIESKPAGKEISRLVEERISESRNLNEGTIAFPQIHENEHQRYAWCIDQLVDGYELSRIDALFYENFTEMLSETEAVYWESYRQLKEG